VDAMGNENYPWQVHHHFLDQGNDSRHSQAPRIIPRGEVLPGELFSLKKQFLDGLLMGSVTESFVTYDYFPRVTVLYHRFYLEDGGNSYLRNVSKRLRICTLP
jgi:hypothetical protein